MNEVLQTFSLGFIWIHSQFFVFIKQQPIFSIIHSMRKVLQIVKTKAVFSW